MTRIALALSPHLDDAAFSAGSTLAGLARQGWRVVIATLFTGNVPHPTGFALACQTSKGIDAGIDYMALRRAEDVRACAALGAEPIHVPLLEAPHRGYNDPLALFGPVREEEAVRAPLEKAITELLACYRPNLVLAPQAVGAHVDHVLVHEAARAMLVSPMWFWRDWPYARRVDSPEPFGAAMRTLPAFVIDRDVSDRLAKADACQAYVSQLGFQFGGTDALDRALAEDGPECFAAADPTSETAPRDGTMPRAS